MNAPHLGDAARKHGIVLLLQFGSSVTGRVHPSSDVDLGVLLERMPASLDAQLELTADLQALVSGREVDVALLNHADPLFLKQVLEHCRRLSGSPRRLEELKLYAFRRYQDHRRFLDMERRYVERAAAAASRKRA
jgi:predicted nucleotidyltransferase